MENKIPLPTDNIYKFYALFGLLIIFFGFGSTLYVNKSTNDLLFGSAVELEILKSEENRSSPKEVKLELLIRKIEIAKKDKKFYTASLGIIIAIGIMMVCYGFKKWHTEVQPVQDEIAKLSLQKLKRELGDN